MGFAQNFARAVEFLLGALPDAKSRRFFLLLTLAQPGAYQETWRQSFKSLNAWHWLMASGLEAYFYLRFLNAGLNLSTRRLSPSLRMGLGGVFLSLASLAFAAATHFRPSVFRALLVGNLRTLCPRLQMWAVLLLAMGMQIFWRPEALGQVAFYLSWALYAAFLWWGTRDLPSWQKSLGLFFTCQAVLLLLCGSGPRGPCELMRFLIGNAVLATIYLGYLLPVSASLLGVAFVGTCLPSPLDETLLNLGRQLFRIPLLFGESLIVVALRALLYS